VSEKPIHEGHRARLREKFISGDAASRSDEALLELLLTFAIQHRDVQPLAKRLIDVFGNFDKVLTADPDALCKIDGIGPTTVALLKLVEHVRQNSPPVLADTKLDERAPCAGTALTLTGPARLNGGGTAQTPRTQAELGLALLGQAELSLQRKPPARERKTIQDVLIPEGLLALKISHEAESDEQLQEILIKRLGQNSMETRRRYAQSILKWFFPDGIDGILSRTWLAYQDEVIISDFLRWSYLSQETVMGRCVADALYPLENGITIPATYFDKFLTDLFGEVAPEKTRERLKINLKKLGFLERAKGKADRLMPVVSQKTSLILLIHHLFAAKSVRTVELRHLFAHSFWKYLGYKSEDAVRNVLREADASGVIGKYIVADQLEQMTTCFTLAELLERKVRI